MYGLTVWIGSNNNQIIGSTANNNSQNGIYLYSNLNNNLTGITANNNTLYGIYLYTSSNDTLTTLTANNNTQHGIYLNSSSNNNQIINSTADYNTIGIHLESSSNNQIINTTTNFNGVYDGIFIFSASNNNTLSGITANSNKRFGLAVYSSSNNNQIINSTINSNVVDGVYIGVNSNNNTFLNNIISLSGLYNIVDDASGTNYLIYNNSFGQIKWTNTNFLRNLTTAGNMTFPGNIIIGNNSAYLNSSAFAGEKINSTANITLYGLSTIIVNPQILKDGALCVNCYNFTSLNAGTVIFNVSSWSNYTISGGTISDTISPYFVTIPPTANINYTQGFGVQFVGADESALDSYSINWTSLFLMNKTGFLQNLTQLSAGTYNINVTINDSSNNINSTIYQVIVNKASRNISLKLNNTLGNINFTSGGKVNASALSSTGQTIQLLRNGVDVLSENNVFETLGAGYYNYTANALTNQNYSFASVSRFLNVTTSSCVQNLQNTSWTSWGNVNCINSVGDRNQSRNKTEYDSNDCGFVNVTYYEYQTVTDGSCDTTPPSVSIAVPENLIYSSSSLGFSVSLNENGTVQFSLNNGGTNYTMSSTDNRNFNYTNSSLTSGSYTFKVYANDSIGNRNESESRVFSVDLTAPTINITSPVNMTYLNSNVTINFTSTSSGTVSSRWFYNGTGNTTYTESMNITLSNGQYIFIFYSNSTSGRENSSRLTFAVYVDTTPPLVTINTPTATTYSSGTVVFNVSLNENGTVQFSLNNGGTNYTMSSTDNRNFNYTNSSLTSGSYTFKVYANDSLGNRNDSSSIGFTVSISSGSDSGSSGGGGGGGGGSSYTTYSFTDEQLLKGESSDLSTEDRIKIILLAGAGETHLMTLNKISTNSIDITVQSEPVNLTLFVGDTDQVRLNSNYVLSIALESIVNGKAKIKTQLINSVGNSQIVKKEKAKAPAKTVTNNVVVDNNAPTAKDYSSVYTIIKYCIYALIGLVIIFIIWRLFVVYVIPKYHERKEMNNTIMPSGNLNEFNSLVNQANQALDRGDKVEAKRIYSMMNDLYRRAYDSLSIEERKIALARSSEIYNRYVNEL